MLARVPLLERIGGLAVIALVATVVWAIVYLVSRGRRGHIGDKEVPTPGEPSRSRGRADQPEPAATSDLPGSTRIGGALLFEAPAKWERSFFSHSPGYVQLTDEVIEFLPHPTLSVIGEGAVLPLTAVRLVEKGDNFLWRGVVHIHLNHAINGRTKYTLFLGSKRSEFLASSEQALAGLGQT